MGVSPFALFFSLDDWAVVRSVFRSVPLEVVLAPLALGICTAAGEKVSALGIKTEWCTMEGRMASPGMTGEKPNRGYVWILLFSSVKAFKVL